MILKFENIKLKFQGQRMYNCDILTINRNNYTHTIYKHKIFKYTLLKRGLEDFTRMRLQLILFRKYNKFDYLPSLYIFMVILGME